MALLLISYDLIGEERPASYESVREVIEEHALDHYKVLYSQWMIVSDQSADEWLDLLNPVIDRNDSLLIIPVNVAEVAAIVAPDVSAWLKALPS